MKSVGSEQVHEPVQAKGLHRQIARRRKRLPELTPRTRSTALPLSHAQERLWFLDQLGLMRTAFNLQSSLKIDGELNTVVLERSLAEIVRRHESLRTRFETVDGAPVQVVDAFESFTIAFQDLSTTAQADPWQEVQRIVNRESEHHFDLARDLLLRAVLLKLGHNEHVLLLTMHHIASDGWSWGILTGELRALYEAYSQGRSSPLADLPVQYADYALWQRQWLQGDILEGQLRYWRDRLSGAPAELTLPSDRPRRPATSFAGASVDFELPSPLVTALRGLARDEGATLFMVLVAAYQALLSRYCGQQDIVIGTPIAGRTHAYTEGLIGFFVNTLALRTNLSGNPTFRRLLQQVKETTLGAYEHQDLPFEKLVAELRPERNLTRQPVLQTLLSLQNYPQECLDLPGVRWESLEAEHVTAQFDLSLHLLEASDELRGMFVYAVDLFDRVTIERITKSFRLVLEAIAADANCPLLRLPILTAAERRQVLHEFNATAADYPQDRAIHELFERHAQRSPDAVAVVCNGQALTYSELNARANQLAHYLIETGLRIGDYVPIVMPRSLEMVIAQLAVLKSGGAYLPLDPDLPAERRAFMVKDSAARRVLADSRPPPELDQEYMRWIDCSRGDFGNQPTADPRRQIDSRLAAYVMYTSGSTGTPKGVVIPHRAVNRLVVNNGYARIEPTDCLAHCSNPAFDASTFEIWGALLNGARVLVVPQAVVLEPVRFAEALAKERVTILWLTVGLFAQYAEALAGVFRQLRYLLTGGDVVEAGTIRWVLRNCPPKHLLSAYGPTECTTFSTTYLVEAMDDSITVVPIGRPISNTQVYVLDSQLGPVPIGVAGEIYIGGAGTALGYVNRPELTKERFLADPFGGDPGQRLYRSGDLGRWRSDGTIEFLGRGDAQVKIRGYRIEPGEIEAQLVRHQDVKEAVVIPREDAPGERQLVAYVTQGPRGAVCVKDLREHLASVLPTYMVPAAFVVLDALPLTANGKLDRRALPPPERDAYASLQLQAPEGPIEQRVAEIWQELLHLERVGRHDSFFELGGHSLLATRLISRLRESFDLDLPLRTIFDAPTVELLSLHIKDEEYRRGVQETDRLNEFAHALRERIRDMPDDAVLARIAELENALRQDEVVARDGVRH